MRRSRAGASCFVAGALASAALAFVPSAEAAPLSCSANAAIPKALRSEGVTEAVGDVAVSCTGGTPTLAGQAIPQYDVQLGLSADTTPAILAPTWTDALLMLDEPGISLLGNLTQAACTTLSGTCANLGNGQGGPTAGAPNYYVGQGSGTNVNVFQGKLGPGASLLWPAVPIDAPGDGKTRVLRLTNVRVNASKFVAEHPGSSAVTASVTIVGGPPTPGTVTVGFIQRGVETAVLGATGDAQLAAPTTVPACSSSAMTRVGTLRFKELFGTVLRPRGVATTTDDPGATANQSEPGTIYNTESGLFNAALVGHQARGDLGRAGLADAGTRLRALFTGVPPGVRLFVDELRTASAPDQARATASESGPFAALAGTGPIEIPVAGGSAEAVWEVTKANANALSELRFGVYAMPPAVVAQQATARVADGLAPLSASDAATVGAPVPRFTGTSSPVDLFTVLPCSGAAGGSGGGGGGGAGGTGGGGPGAPGKVLRIVGELSLNPRAFRAAASGPSVRTSAKTGTTVRLELSEAATVKFTVDREKTGIRRGKRCVKPSATGTRGKKRCKRFVHLRGSFSATAKAGATSLRFTGRLNGAKLAPGRYRLVVKPRTAAGKTEKARTIAFTIVP